MISWMMSPAWEKAWGLMTQQVVCSAPARRRVEGVAREEDRRREEGKK